MPVPVIVWGVLELIAIAITVHELGELAKDLYEGVEKYGKDIGKAKEEVRKVIQNIQDEIARKIEEKEEIAILLALEAADPQGQNTRKAVGRVQQMPPSMQSSSRRFHSVMRSAKCVPQQTGCPF